MSTKILNFKDLKTKKPAELSSYINSLKADKALLVHELATNKTKQTHKLGEIKVAIARANTVLASGVETEKK